MHSPHKYSRHTLPLADLLRAKITGLSSYYLKLEEGDPSVEVSLINLGDLVDDAIDTETVKIVAVKKTEKLKSDTLLPGDVVFTLRGSPLRAVVAGDDVAGAVLSANLVGLRCSELIQPEILAAWFNSSAGQHALLTRAGKSTLTGISLKELLEIEIPVPPKAQQDLMSKYLALASEHLRILKKEQEILDSIVDSMMTSL